MQANDETRFRPTRPTLLEFQVFELALLYTQVEDFQRLIVFFHQRFICGITRKLDVCIALAGVVHLFAISFFPS
jgi:hypothetical protein